MGDCLFPTNGEGMDDETRIQMLEPRAGQAELRTSLAEFRLDVTQRLDTLIGAIADLRQEDYGHTPGEG